MAKKRKRTDFSDLFVMTLSEPLPEYVIPKAPLTTEQLNSMPLTDVRELYYAYLNALKIEHIKYRRSVHHHVTQTLRIMSERKDIPFNEQKVMIDYIRILLGHAYYAVVCPRCNEAAKIDVVKPKNSDKHYYYYRHGTTTTHSSETVSTQLIDLPFPSKKLA